ncbi:cupin domain-containing protein [Ideonella sp.]|uniref:cupin domain-containing protein n=1 Tax=Ideonella sp. TaxID=1929293 RepID=UPI0035B44125
MNKINLLHEAAALPAAWQSLALGQAAGATLKVLRMDGAAYPSEAHGFEEALLVLDGQMNLDMEGLPVIVRRGELAIVPAGVRHAVAAGSHGTLVVIDR